MKAIVENTTTWWINFKVPTHILQNKQLQLHYCIEQFNVANLQGL